MNISFSLTPADYAAALLQISHSDIRPRGPVRYITYALGTISCGCLAFGLLILLRTLTDYSAPPRQYVQLGLWLLVASLFVLGPLTLWIARRTVIREQWVDEHDDHGTNQVEISEDGLRIETIHELTLRRWPSILKVVDNGLYAFVYLAPRAVLPIPASAFGSAQEFRRFTNALAKYVPHRDA